MRRWAERVGTVVIFVVVIVFLTALHGGFRVPWPWGWGS